MAHVTEMAKVVGMAKKVEIPELAKMTLIEEMTEITVVAIFHIDNATKNHKKISTSGTY